MQKYALFLSLFLGACGGGGASASPSVSNPNQLVVQSTPVPQGSFLPFSKGTQYNFANGGMIEDAGSGVYNCQCAANGTIVEEFDFHNLSGYSGSYYIDYVAPYTNLFGASSVGEIGVVPFSLLTYPQFPSGIPFLNDNGGMNNGNSLFVSNASMNGNEEISALSVPSYSVSITWTFVRGQGIVSVTQGGITLNVTSKVKR